jgi:DNA polymerase
METLEDGNKPDLISEENQANETYYQKLYSIRLDWSKHSIPVSVLWCGLYIEAYILTVGKVDLFDSKQVECKLAFIGNKIPYSVKVPTNCIYPSKRKFYKMGDTNLIPSSLVEWPSLPLDKFDTTKLQLINVVLPGVQFTLFELASLLNCNLYNIQPELLKEVGVKHCLISAKDSISFVTNMPVKDYTPRESLIDLEQEYNNCIACELGVKRIDRGCKLVFGRGNPSARLMVIAEAPGRQEEETGVVLYPEAPAGGALYKVMNKVGIKQEDCYLTNTVICRPLAEAGSNSENGKPQDHQIKACNARLKRTLRTVSPRVVVLVGTFAFTSWFGHIPPGGILKNLGEKTELNEAKEPINYRVYVIPHPSYVIRAKGEELKQLKTEYLAHWQNIKKILEET